MTLSDDPPIQRKLIAILRVINERGGAVGARIISDSLKEQGHVPGERGVRYHLRILNERGLTKGHGYAGRTITKLGRKEIDEAIVHDRIGFMHARIEEMLYQADFDPISKSGTVIANITRTCLANYNIAAKYIRNHEITQIFTRFLC